MDSQDFDMFEVANTVAAEGVEFQTPVTASLEVAPTLSATLISTAFGTDTAEIVAVDAASGQFFVAGGEFVDIFDLATGEQITFLDVVGLGVATGLGFDEATSVAASNGLVAFAADAGDDPAGLVFFEADNPEATLSFVEIPAGPDAVTFTPDGDFVLVAIEGEGDDLPGGVAIVTVATGEVDFVGFANFEADADALIAEGFRLFSEDGGDISVSLGTEPEFVSVSSDGNFAFVSLQENNAIGVLDLTLASPAFTDIIPLGTQDFDAPGVAFDVSDEDGGANLAPVPFVEGFLQPDAVASFDIDGATFFAIVNEGDSFDDDVVRIEDAVLDPTLFPDAATLQLPENLGRLEVSLFSGDTDGDGDLDELLAFGGRSFSILDSEGNIVFDSGSFIDEFLAAEFPDLFNDARSDDAGAEPEGVVAGVIDGETFLFVGLERSASVLIFNVEDPTAPTFAGIVEVPFDPVEGEDLDDLVSPEGLAFVSAADSPTGAPLLLVSDEEQDVTFTFELGAIADDVGATDGDDDLVGTEGDDFIDGLGGNDVIDGLGGDDVLIGGPGSDVIAGGDGDDIIAPGVGADVVDGGEGFDFVDLSDIPFGVELNFNTDEIAYVNSAGVTVVDVVTDVEGAIGTDFDDAFQGDGEDNVFAGFGGDDIIFAGAGDDLIFGGDGSITGSGNDIITGGDGDDMIAGEDGVDFLAGNQGDDFIVGNTGSDIIQGGFGDDIIDGGDNFDFLFGGEGSDTILGGNGQDTIGGGAGADFIEGGDGADTINGAAGADNIQGGAGADTILGGEGDDVIAGGLGADVIDGGAGADTIVGGLLGGFAGDTINGLTADDILLFTGDVFEADQVTIGADGVTSVDLDGDGASDASFTLGIAAGLDVVITNDGVNTTFAFEVAAPPATSFAPSQEQLDGLIERAASLIDFLNSGGQAAPSLGAILEANTTAPEAATAAESAGITEITDDPLGALIHPLEDPVTLADFLVG